MEHTRNQKRMYRIKKLEEKIVDLENISKKSNQRTRHSKR